MISLNEIRVGNWFEHNAEWCYRQSEKPVPFQFQWSDRDWHALGESTLFLENVSPIPLTPSILEACGFEFRFISVSFPGWYSKPIGKYKYSMRIWEEGADAFCLSINENLTINLMYLHQLQNIFHSLSGEELVYQPIKELT